MDDTNGVAHAARSSERRIPKFRLRTKSARLLTAALEHFAATSFEKTRVADITRRLGLSQGALYLHFPSKRALFDRVIEEYCLPQDADAPSTEEELTSMLCEEPAATILRIVLREWSSEPSVALHYLEAISSRLEAAHITPSIVRDVVSSALARAAATVIFSPALVNVAEDRRGWRGGSQAPGDRD